MSLEWKFNSFEELSLSGLYAILRLRNEVFVVEQNCVYQDADGKDEISFHITGWDKNTLVAYCRVLPPGSFFPETSIGGVVTSPRYRHGGYGKQLMELAVRHIPISQFPNIPISQYLKYRIEFSTFSTSNK